MEKKQKLTLGYAIVFIFVGLYALMCLYPFLLVISGSFTPKDIAMREGFSLIPKGFTLEAYTLVFVNSDRLLRAYTITILVTACGTFLALIVNSMMAFVLARPGLPGRKFINIYVLITMLFSGGMVPWYIVCTQYLNLKDSYLALVIPMVASAWNVFLIRNYFSSMPNDLYESAKIDGASDFRVFWNIYFPLAKPVMATVTLFAALAYWNDWWHGLMLIDKQEMQPLQMLLRAIIANLQFMMTQNSSNSPWMNEMMARIPAEGVRMAFVIITTGPIILLYPFVQRYFVKGIMVGAVKG